MTVQAYNCMFHSCLGFVAFLIDSHITPGYYLYSPNGNCQANLGKITTAGMTQFDFGFMALLNKQIVVCGMYGHKTCFLYDVRSNTWTEYSKSNVAHFNVRGVVHKVTTRIFICYLHSFKISSCLSLESITSLR